MMVFWVMLAVGVLLSAFFSGSETGFYRVNRVRLVLNSRDGDWVAWGLLQLTNNPSLFVATTLIGNNLANYITSLAIVLIAQGFFAPHSHVAELVAPIVLSPILFVYGELLPKRLFLMAPNRLVRRGGPLFLLFVLIFAPVAALLWALGRLLQYLLGESPERVRLTLARKELSHVFDEGQEVGISHLKGHGHDLRGAAGHGRHILQRAFQGAAPIDPDFKFQTPQWQTERDLVGHLQLGHKTNRLRRQARGRQGHDLHERGLNQRLQMRAAIGQCQSKQNC